MPMFSHSAFSLLEILVSIAILAVIVSGIFLALDTGNNSYSQDMGLLDLQQRSRWLMDNMVRDLRQASVKTIPAANQINITTPAGQMQYYSNANNQLIREFPIGTPVVLSNNVSALTFCCWSDLTSTCTADCAGTNLIEIALTSSKTVNRRNLNFSLKGQVVPRNE